MQWRGWNIIEHPEKIPDAIAFEQDLEVGSVLGHPGEKEHSDWGEAVMQCSEEEHSLCVQGTARSLRGIRDK